MVLPDVHSGQPHEAAHNDERGVINSLSDRLDALEELDIASTYAKQSMFGSMVSGHYYSLNGPDGGGTIAVGNKTMRLTPGGIPRDLTLSKLAVAITAGGDAGSTVKCLVYDDADGYPGDLIGSTAAAPAVLGVADLDCDIDVTAGNYWYGIHVLGVVSAAPAFRGTITPVPTPFWTQMLGTDITTANLSVTLKCYQFTGLDAPPATASPNGGIATVGIRIFGKVA